MTTTQDNTGYAVPLALMCLVAFPIGLVFLPAAFAVAAGMADGPDCIPYAQRKADAQAGFSPEYRKEFC